MIMKQVWKWIMHLNAKAFCAVAALFFAATTLWCGYLYMTPPEPIKEGVGQLPPAPEPWVIGILDFVSDQAAGDGAVVPLNPFVYPPLDKLSPDALKDVLNQIAIAKSNPGGGVSTLGNLEGKPPPAGVGDSPAPGSAPDMIAPRISFLGFVRRSDGSSVALFADSSDSSSVFYAPGKMIHGIEILGADMKEAQVRYPDGSVGKIPIGGAVELAPEPRKDAKPVA
ncbi:MAG: hypothetical protein FWG50_02140 [Kiritimatiellaeota bacterium]|nr:hypothetical protein [Kiritimatiellota bacterium]